MDRQRVELEEERACARRLESSRDPAVTAVLNALNLLASKIHENQLKGLARLAAVVDRVDLARWRGPLQHLGRAGANALDAFIAGGPSGAQALHCLAAMSRVKGFLARSGVLDRMASEGVVGALVAWAGSEDAGVAADAVVVVSRLATRYEGVVEAAQGLVARAMALPPEAPTGRLFYAVAKWRGANEEVRAGLRRALESATVFNARFALRAYAGLVSDDAVKGDIRELLGLFKAIIAGDSDARVLKEALALLRVCDVDAELLALVYVHAQNWSAANAVAGLRLLSVNFEAFAAIAHEVGLGGLIACINECDRRVKLVALELVLRLNEARPLTDMALVEPMLVLAEDPECAPFACELILQVMREAVRRGETEAFRAAVLPFASLLSDIELDGGDDASARVAREILEIVSA